MTRRTALALVAAAAALPRLAVLVYERGDILAAYTEKSDRFATVFVEHGTYGFVPGEPSAYTQPLYGWFLIPVYWIFGRHWLALGLAQTLLAVVAALCVFAIARRFLSLRAAALAAVVATLNPYLVWHDVHVNREIVDQVVLTALVLATLAAVERRSTWLAALAGILSGLAILGNTRLAFLPVLVAAYLAWRLRAAVPAVAVLALAAIAVAPWLVRNKANVGCWAITTDARALWKANNPNTYETLASGRWIDDVPEPADRPGYATYTPEAAGDVWQQTGRRIQVDECRQMRHYQHLVFEFWREHPGEKARLAGQATSELWDPRATETTQRPGEGTHLDAARRWVQGGWMSVLYALAIPAVFLVGRRIAVLVLALLAYNTLAAAVFAGTTRYRVPFDFLLALLAAVTIATLAERRRRSRLP